jgi:hypothetical protein
MSGYLNGLDARGSAAAGRKLTLYPGLSREILKRKSRDCSLPWGSRNESSVPLI